MMINKRIYGLPSYDLGDWAQGSEERIGRWIENPNTGFRVYYAHPHPRTESSMRYIVCKDGFCMGFSMPFEGGYHHVDDPQRETSYVIIEMMGGLYYTDTAYKREGFIKLADATRFDNLEQQSAYIEALKEAVPCIPVFRNYIPAQDGGFGYEVRFTKEISRKMANGEFIQNDCK